MSDLIVIIGLCGSGKSFLCQKYNNYVIFDDFITHFYNGNLINSIKNKDKVCISDPRLCIHNIFIKFMKEIELYVNKNNIELILFENDPDACIINVKDRNDGKNGIINTINRYSTFYNLDNYKDYQHIIIPVWKNS